jgi:hypothetical protein
MNARGGKVWCRIIRQVMGPAPTGPEIGGSSPGIGNMIRRGEAVFQVSVAEWQLHLTVDQTPSGYGGSSPSRRT